MFLLAAAILSGMLLSGDLIRLTAGNSTVFSLSFAGMVDQGGDMMQRLWPMTIILAIVPLLALVAIFLYRNRSLQMRLTMLVLLLSLGTIMLGAFYVFMFDRKIDVTVIWRVKALFPIITAIFAWLAYRAIMKDEIRVKSYDRLR